VAATECEDAREVLKVADERMYGEKEAAEARGERTARQPSGMPSIPDRRWMRRLPW